MVKYRAQWPVYPLGTKTRVASMTGMKKRPNAERRLAHFSKTTTTSGEPEFTSVG